MAAFMEHGFGRIIGLTYDGVEVYTYGCSNEWEDGHPDGVGTFVHEFSHVMGLPDLYATSYTDAFTPGAWSALDYGPYNNEGMTPPNYGAFERYALGWMKPSEITEPLSANLLPIGENMAGIIRTGKDTEFSLSRTASRQAGTSIFPVMVCSCGMWTTMIMSGHATLSTTPRRTSMWISRKPTAPSLITRA